MNTIAGAKENETSAVATSGHSLAPRSSPPARCSPPKKLPAGLVFKERLPSERPFARDVSARQASAAVAGRGCSNSRSSSASPAVPSTPMGTIMTDEWKQGWRSTIRPTKYPGIYERREGGHLVRALVTDATTGRRKEIKKVLPDATLAQAAAYLEGRKEQCRAGDVLPPTSKKRFAVFAVDHYDHKVATRRIVSEAGKRKWKYVLLHLIEGTKDGAGRLLVRGFGEFFVDEIRVVHIEKWKAQVTTKLLDTGLYAPTTTNGWLDILKGIMKAAKRDLELPRNPAEDVEPFDMSEHETYTVEEPNALTPEEVTEFLDALFRMYPQHYCMTVLGLVTGLRPSSLRPLRRCGETPDVRWEKAVLEIRRSQTIGERVMKTTKTKRHQTISLPPALLELLEWHVRTQLTTPEMQASELLFPSVDGGFRAASVLNKPFKIVADEIGLGKKFTQRGLRRTFQDLARTAQVSDLVTRSISGHATEAMQRHYSTVYAEEQRSALARVAELAKVARPAPLLPELARQEPPRDRI